jgi:hypothetical protein
VLVKGRPLRHATPVTYVWTGTAGCRSRSIWSSGGRPVGEITPCCSAGPATHPSGDLAACRRSWHVRWCEGYSGLVPRRYCKETLPIVQRLIESRGL